MRKIKTTNIVVATTITAMPRAGTSERWLWWWLPLKGTVRESCPGLEATGGLGDAFGESVDGEGSETIDKTQ